MGNAQPAHALSASSRPPMATSSSRRAAAAAAAAAVSDPPMATSDVAYRALSLDFGPGVTVPVAVWHPVLLDDSTDDSSDVSPKSGRRRSSLPPPANAAAGPKRLLTEPATYSHRISVSKIGDLLAGWDFIPSFASRSFVLQPTLRGATVYAAPRLNVLPLPSTAPVVILAHGYLGSRFDLSHLAETLASQGYVVVSPEYPESLAASYPRTEGVDRAAITAKLVATLENEWEVRPTAYGIVGHSLGTGTVNSSGDDSWTRVCIAGRPSDRDSPALFIGSTNDGAVSLSKLGALPRDYVALDEGSLFLASSASTAPLLPRKAALIFDRPDAPNHISFLAEGPNDAMVQFLSPLLPVAQAMDIPVLDFDKYAKVRDSRPTAEVVVPLVSRYLRDHMKQ